jgi:hypothetical protein
MVLSGIERGRNQEAVKRKRGAPLWPETGKTILGLSKGTTYAAAARGDIRIVQLGRLKRVPTAWLKAKLGLDEPAK